MRLELTGEYTEGGNAIKIYNETELVCVGNDYYGKEDWGRFVVQSVNDYGIWDEVENGIVDSEDEAEKLIEDLLEVGFDGLRYRQI